MLSFFTEDTNFELANPTQVADWVENMITSEGFTPGAINYIFCSDDHLHGVNLEYLNHDTYTDIVTFDLSEEEGIIQADIFISVDRVAENANVFKSTFIDELHRVIIHGVLHLIGYNDKTDELQQMMRKKEDTCLSLRQF